MLVHRSKGGSHRKLRGWLGCLANESAFTRSASFLGSLLVALLWLATSICVSVPAVASNPDTCSESGGPAYCVGPEIGPYWYQVSDGNIGVGRGPDQATAVAAYQQTVVQHYTPYNLCNINVTNDLPPWPLATPGGGSAQSGDYTQALYYGNGQYWSINWVFSTEGNSQIIPLVYKITYGSGCSSAYGPFGVYVARGRDLSCPGGYTGPYRPNLYTTPTN